jgi:hypothetical protein
MMLSMLLAHNHIQNSSWAVTVLEVTDSQCTVWYKGHGIHTWRILRHAPDPGCLWQPSWNCIAGIRSAFYRTTSSRRWCVSTIRAAYAGDNRKPYTSCTCQSRSSLKCSDASHWRCRNCCRATKNFEKLTCYLNGIGTTLSIDPSYWNYAQRGYYV